MAEGCAPSEGLSLRKVRAADLWTLKMVMVSLPKLTARRRERSWLSERDLKRIET
jgi:hypothetical protein